MRPGLFDWPPQYAGDTADTISFTVERNGEAVDLTGSSIRMQVRECVRHVPILSLSTDDGVSIVVTDGPSGKFRVGQYKIPTASGSYQYDVEVTFPDGVVKTYLKGNYVIDGEITT